MKNTYINVSITQLIGAFLLLFLVFIPHVSANDSTLKYQITKPDLTPEGEIKSDVEWVYTELQGYLEQIELKEGVSLNYLTEDDKTLVLVAINNTDKTVQELEDVRIDLGEVKNKEVIIGQSNLGSLEPHHAYPIIIELTEDELDSLGNVDFNTVEINDYSVKYTDQSVFWKFYIVNLIFSIIAYKLGFARELPLWKSVFVYIMLVIGVFVLTIFSLMELPITESLIIISLVLAIYRYRMHLRRKKKNEA